MANIGTYPELEKRLFCASCLAGAHGKVLTYNHADILEGIENGSYKFSGQCAHCSSQLEPEAAPEPVVVEATAEPAHEAPAPPSGRRSRASESST